jgi:hypothetical protein
MKTMSMDQVARANFHLKTMCMIGQRVEILPNVETEGNLNHLPALHLKSCSAYMTAERRTSSKKRNNYNRF